jgi:SSS family solute:Na+ symporter
LVVCSVVGVGVTLANSKLEQLVKSTIKSKTVAYALIALSTLLFVLIVGDFLPLSILIVLAIVLIFLVAMTSFYLIDYDPEGQTSGLTVWSVQKAKEVFKGRKINEAEGEKVTVAWKKKDGEDGVINFSKNDMKKMAAEVGDFVYISDKRKWLGGLKSIHSVYGEPHTEDGVVYLSNEDLLNGVFEEGKVLEAEKEM